MCGGCGFCPPDSSSPRSCRCLPLLPTRCISSRGTARDRTRASFVELGRSARRFELALSRAGGRSPLEVEVALPIATALPTAGAGQLRDDNVVTLVPRHSMYTTTNGVLRWNPGADHIPRGSRSDVAACPLFPPRVGGCALRTRLDAVGDVFAVETRGDDLSVAAGGLPGVSSCPRVGVPIHRDAHVPRGQGAGRSTTIEHGGKAAGARQHEEDASLGDRQLTWRSGRRERSPPEGARTAAERGCDPPPDRTSIVTDMAASGMCKPGATPKP